MDFRILGPLEVTADRGDRLALTGQRQRALLALLLLHRNEVVPSEQLVEGLWEGEPPPSAPKALQNAVSQVRRALAHGEPGGAGPLDTAHGGYVLHVAPGELDADCFEALLADGRDALDEGDPVVAGDRLREALRLWRGPPLAELAYERFAQSEIRRLEELRLAALEERIEADLAVGRHADLVAELEALVEQHPLRERMRAQLMLALYRTGRQAEALEVFRDGRRALIGELGIEPGPELRARHDAILRQDEALTAVPRARRTRTVHPRHASVLLLGAALLALAAAAAAALMLARGDRTPAAGLPQVRGNSLVAIDVRSARPVASYPTGGTPTSVAAGVHGAWALNADDATLTRVSDQTSTPRTLSVPGTPIDLAAGAEGVWALAGRGGAHFRLVELEPTTGATRRTVALPPGEDATWFSLNRLALAPDALWAIGAEGRLLRIDPSGVRPIAAVRGLDASAVVASGDGAWAIARSPLSHVLAHVSAAGRVTKRVPVVAAELDGLAAGAGAAWVTAPQEGLLWRVTPESTRSIDVGAGARGVAVAGGSVWVANAARGTVTRVDPRAGRVTATVRLGNAPRGVATDGDRLWVTVAAAAGAPASDAERAASGAVTAPACSAVVAGAAAPDRLIVSDLPLHLEGMSSVADAIAFALRRREFRAGRFDVGYQSCDDSTAKQRSFDPEKCRANAALYAQTPRVVGVIGPYNSDCALEQLAVTNRAPGGPLATISPTNTLLELTKPLPGGDPGPVTRLYPTGERHYARLLGANDGQGAALAQFAHEQGARRLAIVYDEFDYGRTIAWYARRAARRLGLGLTGVYRIRVMRGAAPARALGRRLARARPDALLYAGVPFWGPSRGERPAFALVRSLRERLGRELPVIGPDAWADGPSVFAELRSYARGIHFTQPGVPVARLGAEGQRFAAEFGATQPGGIVRDDGVLAAQAVELLLDAIARSDGTRGSVTRALLATDIDDGLIGPVRFDPDGDIRPRPFSVIRLTRRTGVEAGLIPTADVAAIIEP
jgi:DNA-binding SARP family transcriptional activator